MEASATRSIHTVAAGREGISSRILQEIRKPSQMPSKKPRTFYTQEGVWKGWVDLDGNRHQLTLCPTEMGGDGVLLLRGVPGKSSSLVATKNGGGHLVLELGNELTPTDVRRLANQLVADIIADRIRVKRPAQAKPPRIGPPRRSRHDRGDRYRSLSGYFS